jgi:hypothetical protein
MAREQLDLDSVAAGHAERALQLQAADRDIDNRNRLMPPVAMDEGGNRCRAPLVLAAESRRPLDRRRALRLGTRLHHIRPFRWKPVQSLAPPS